MSHTPGPWIPESVRVMDKPGTLIAKCGTASRFLDEAEDNARLIAKAPQLLSVLQEIWDWADNREDIDWNDQPNNAMEVKSLINTVFGGRP